LPGINFNSVDFASGTTSGLVDSGDVLTLAPGRLETLEYTDPFASVPVLGKAVDGSGTDVLGIHHGHYSEFDNGGEAWCSPSSTAMVVRYWRGRELRTRRPASRPRGVDPPVDGEVDVTARYVYDYCYQGAGNLPFNTAYAAERGLVSDVTRLHDLSEAEAFVRAGVPLVASVAWAENQLDTAIQSSTGHLVVIGGFTEEGNGIAYDPASETNDRVRHIYDRERFERAWIPASGGIVYVIRPADWWLGAP
jgi:hypothetical protein